MLIVWFYQCYLFPLSYSSGNNRTAGGGDGELYFTFFILFSFMHCPSQLTSFHLLLTHPMASYLIPVFFYTYNGAFGKSPGWVNIAIFFISAAVVYIFETKLFNASKFDAPKRRGCFAALCVLGLLFFLFTFVQPHIPLFMDPSTRLYGMAKN